MGFSDRVAFVVPIWLYEWEIIAFFGHYKGGWSSKMEEGIHGKSIFRNGQQNFHEVILQNKKSLERDSSKPPKLSIQRKPSMGQSILLFPIFSPTTRA